MLPRLPLANRVYDVLRASEKEVCFTYERRTGQQEGLLLRLLIYYIEYVVIAMMTYLKRVVFTVSHLRYRLVLVKKAVYYTCL